jgi:hypothetical protein
VQHEFPQIAVIIAKLKENDEPLQYIKEFFSLKDHFKVQKINEKQEKKLQEEKETKQDIIKEICKELKQATIRRKDTKKLQSTREHIRIIRINKKSKGKLMLAITTTSHIDRRTL